MYLKLRIRPQYFVVCWAVSLIENNLIYELLCLECTFCGNPCPNCVTDSLFNIPSKWNECAKFNVILSTTIFRTPLIQCGPNTRSSFGAGEHKKNDSNTHFECSNVENDITYWKVNGSSQAENLQITCESTFLHFKNIFLKKIEIF